MAVQVVGQSLMTSEQTEHQAKSVGDGKWVVSFMPGRTLRCDQAVAAIQAAEAVALLNVVADLVGLTTLETVGLALQDSPWEDSPPKPPRDRWRWVGRCFGTLPNLRGGRHDGTH
ncbi:hypothetical protein AB0E01_22560 [Nocardia vinacea]|uniref:hypothetical protein n=1 Tax=Nocardia vinacea TaxID=96468 RepID=UPI003402B2F5